MDALPSGYCENLDPLDERLQSCKMVKLNKLASVLKSDGIYDIQVSTYEHFLRYNHFTKGGMHIYMFHNEEPSRDIETTVRIPTELPVRIYNAMDNTLELADVAYKGGKAEINVKLGQYESAFYVFSSSFTKESCTPVKKELSLTSLRVVVYPDSDGEQEVELTELCDLGAPDMFPNYGDKLIYKATFNIVAEIPSTLDLGRVCDSAIVTLNGINLGCRTASPFQYDITSAVKAGLNELTVEVKTNPARAGATSIKEQALISVSAATFSALEPVGMLGPITVRF